jgi:pimeloyl-ACP methyl ester carboxylesterase
MWFALLERVQRLVLNLRGYRSRWVNTQYGRIHYLDARGHGALPPIVFLHGISGWSGELSPVFTPLRRHVRRILVLDLPGHGSSPAPHGGMRATAMFGAIEAALTELLDEPAILFGNSMGGFAAVRFAHAQPRRVRGLFLSSPGGARMSEPELRAFAAQFQAAAASNPRELVDRLFEKSPPLPGVVAAYVKHRFSREAIGELLDGVRADDLLRPEEVASLAAPTLLVWGRLDRVQPTSQLEFFRHHLPPHARIEEPEHFTHCPYLEHGDELADRVLRFSRVVTSVAVSSASPRT